MGAVDGEGPPVVIGVVGAVVAHAEERAMNMNATDVARGFMDRGPWWLERVPLSPENSAEQVSEVGTLTPRAQRSVLSHPFTTTCALWRL